MSDSVAEPSKRPRYRLWPLFCVMCSLIPVGLYLATWFSPISFVAELIGNFQAQIFLLFVPFPFLLWFARCRMWALIVAGLALLSASNVIPAYLPVQQMAAGPTRLRVMAFNVLGTNDEFAAVAEQIRELDPDVLVFTEFTERWHHALQPLHKTYPYRVAHPRWHGFGIALFSKRPFMETEDIFLTPALTDCPAIMATVEVDGTPLHIVGTHVTSPTDTHRMDMRNQQLSELSRQIQKLDGPQIVVGDFNCVPWSTYLKRLMVVADLRDSRHGFGYQGTFHGKLPPFLRIPIDHAFVSEELHVVERFVGERCGSDHLPIICDVSISRRSEQR